MYYYSKYNIKKASEIFRNRNYFAYLKAGKQKYLQ